MKNDNFYKTLRIVCLILAIVCMALSLIKKSKAETYSYIYDELSTDIDNIGSVSASAKNQVLNYVYNYDYCFKISVSNGTWCYVFYNDSDLNFRFRQNNSYSIYDELLFDSYDVMTYGLKSSVEYYTVYLRAGTLYSVLRTYNGTNKAYDNNRYGYRFNTSNPCDLISTESRSYFPYNISNYTLTGNYTNDFYLYSLSGSTNQNISSWKLFSEYTQNQLYPEPPSVNTEGFDVYKYGSENNQRLVCDFTDCISISNAVGNTSTISLTVEIDSVETTLNFDSTSSYYYYGSFGNEAARYSFPFSVLGITTNTINARLLSVHIDNTTSSPGGSYHTNINWISPISLVGSNYEDETASVISKDTLPDYDHFDDPGTQQSYKETTNRWLTSTYSTLPLSLFNRWNFEVRYKVIPVYEEGLGSSALNAFLTAITQALNLQFGDVVQTAIELYNGHSIYEIIEEVLQNNQYSDYYDLIAFCYQDADGSDPVYYIYTTDTYNNHLTNSYLYDIMQTIYDDGKALESIYNYLYNRLDDFETKSLNKMNEAVGLGEIENDLLEKIRKLLDQILDAILNLDLEVPEADYTDILTKLDTIIENQDTSDINDDWYQNYREWLYGINENDSYLSPHEYFNNIFGTLKTTFDSFTNNISFNAYLLKVEDFINHISGNTTDNITIYLRDGIGDPGFNINNNYMYTVGGS